VLISKQQVMKQTTTQTCQTQILQRGNLAASRKDLLKEWLLINELSSRQSKKTNIADIEIGDMKINSASEMAEAVKITSHFNYFH